MHELVELIRNLMSLNPTTNNFIASVFTVFIIWFLRKLILRTAFQQTTDPKLRYQWRKSTEYLAIVLGILLIGRIWFEGFNSLTNFLGLLSAGVAIALKDPILNLVGWMFIIWRKPFEVSDRIQIGTYAGDVIDIRMFQFDAV